MELHYRQLGEGPALIILHGLFGSLDNWLTLGRQFAIKRSVFLVDQRNHGRSPHSEAMSYALFSSDLEAFMEQHGIRQAAVLGHSMGGKTAMRFALDHPDQTEALVVADMAPKAYAAGHDQIFQALFSIDLEGLSSRSEAEEQLSLAISDPGVRLFLLKNLQRNAQGGFAWKMNLPAIHRHYAGILEPISADFPYPGPTLFIRGERSGYVREQDYPLISELFPRVEHAAVPGAGHWLHAEQPDLFFQEVEAFLDRVQPV
jgi:esterase